MPVLLLSVNGVAGGGAQGSWTWICWWLLTLCVGRCQQSAPCSDQLCYFFPLGPLAAKQLSFSEDSLSSRKDNFYLLHTSFPLHLTTLLLSPHSPLQILACPLMWDLCISWSSVLSSSLIHCGFSMCGCSIFMFFLFLISCLSLLWPDAEACRKNPLLLLYRVAMRPYLPPWCPNGDDK